MKLSFMAKKSISRQSGLVGSRVANSTHDRRVVSSNGNGVKTTSGSI